MKVETTRFGSLEVEEGDVICFRDGLYGFEQEKAFARLPFAPNVENPMEWLQSLKTPSLAFVITDPFLFIPDYSVVLTSEEKKQIEIENADQVVTRAIVTLPENFLEMTANLVAPLVINLDRMLAKQFVLATTEYDTRHFLLPPEVREARVKVGEP